MSMGRNRDQPWSYRYYEITLSSPARVRAQLAFRVGDDLGVGRPSIYTTASLAGIRSTSHIWPAWGHGTMSRLSTTIMQAGTRSPVPKWRSGTKALDQVPGAQTRSGLF